MRKTKKIQKRDIGITENLDDGTEPVPGRVHIGLNKKVKALITTLHDTTFVIIM